MSSSRLTVDQFSRASGIKDNIESLRLSLEQSVPVQHPEMLKAVDRLAEAELWLGALLTRHAPEQRPR